jgi:hypothetical protein
MVQRISEVIDRLNSGRFGLAQRCQGAENRRKTKHGEDTKNKAQSDAQRYQAPSPDLKAPAAAQHCASKRVEAQAGPRRAR